jgi:hypothetical protein
VGAFTETVVEHAALVCIEAGGWQIAHGSGIAPASVTNFDEVQAHDWLAVNQCSNTEYKHTGQPDVPLVVDRVLCAALELDDAAIGGATSQNPFRQFQSSKADFELEVRK